jgi:hypothetical protein
MMNYVQSIDSVRSNRTSYKKKTISRDKIELIPLSWVRFDPKFALTSIVSLYNEKNSFHDLFENIRINLGQKTFKKEE